MKRRIASLADLPMKARWTSMGVMLGLMSAWGTYVAIAQGPPNRAVGWSTEVRWTGLDRASAAGGGSLSSSRLDGRAGVAFMGWPPARLTLSAVGEDLRYAFRGALDDRVPEAFERVSAVGFGLTAAAPLNEDWSVFGLADLEFVRARGGDWDDAVSGGGLVFFSRRLSDRFTLSPGVLLRARIEEGFLAVPILGLDWKITDRLELSLSERLALRYRLDARGRWRAGLEAVYVPRAARHRDDLEGSSTFRDRAAPVVASLAFQPHPGLNVQVFAGTTLWHELKLTGPEGAEHVGLDPAPLAGFSARLRF